MVKKIAHAIMWNGKHAVRIYTFSYDAEHFSKSVTIYLTLFVGANDVKMILVSPGGWTWPSVASVNDIYSLLLRYIYRVSYDILCRWKLNE